MTTDTPNSARPAKQIAGNDDPMAGAKIEDVLQARAEHVNVIKSLFPYVWPADRPDLKIRVVLAFIALVIAKVITVSVPLAYKAAVDWLTGSATGSDLTGSDNVFMALALLPVMVIVAYGGGRVMMMVFNQLRDVLFTKVGQNAVRRLANRTFRHLHQLSLRFHVSRRTGGLSRVIERAIHAVELIIRMGILSTIPTIIELAFIAGLVVFYFGWNFVVIIVVTVVTYIWFTIKATNWRIEIRRELNDADTEANAKTVDSLLNYETVKYFGNEELEAQRFDISMGHYEDAAIRTYTSLGILNSGQALIYSIGLTLCMLLAANGVVTGEFTIGDFVMINALLIQLYAPLNLMGFVYREVRQGLVDLETMFALLEEHPEIPDNPNAAPLNITKGVVRFENVSFFL